MARRTDEITISAEGRDQGKKFLLTEMDAFKAEKWASRAMLALGKSGVQIDDDIVGAGWGVLVVLGVRMLAGVEFAEAEPLLDEMVGQIQIVEPLTTRSLTPDDIEEVATLIHLRSEVLGLHLGFPRGATISKLRALAPQLSSMPDTETSQPASA